MASMLGEMVRIGNRRPALGAARPSNDPSTLRPGLPVDAVYLSTLAMDLGLIVSVWAMRGRWWPALHLEAVLPRILDLRDRLNGRNRKSGHHSRAPRLADCVLHRQELAGWPAIHALPAKIARPRKLSGNSYGKCFLRARLREQKLGEPCKS